MKVGDYVRTKFGQIGKLEHIGEYNINIEFGRHIQVIAKTEDYKSSPNIIDLIEYSDIVKYKIDDEEFISEVWGDKNDYFVQNFDVPIDLRDLNIVSIVTKEQFESMEYKI